MKDAEDVAHQKDPKLLQVWSQTKVPVVFRGGKTKALLVRLPYSRSNREWLKDDHRNNPEWLPAYKCWGVPKSWFEDVIRRILHAYGSVYVVQPFSRHQKCAPACWNAVGAECECSCMGAHHGSGNPEGQWHVVSDTFAVKWETREYSCRLLSQKNRIITLN